MEYVQTQLGERKPGIAETPYTTNVASFGIAVPGSTVSYIGVSGLNLPFPAVSCPTPFLQVHRQGQVNRASGAELAQEQSTDTVSERAIARSASITLAKELVRETLGACLLDMRTELKEDPEDVGHVTVCLVLIVRGSVEEIYELDRNLQARLIDRIPERDFPFIGVLYHFE